MVFLDPEDGTTSLKQQNLSPNQNHSSDNLSAAKTINIHHLSVSVFSEMPE